MSHEAQIIRALKSAVGDYKQAIHQKDAAIRLQKKAIAHLRAVVEQIIPHTDYSEEDKVRLLEAMGLETKPKLEVVKHDS